MFFYIVFISMQSAFRMEVYTMCAFQVKTMGHVAVEENDEKTTGFSSIFPTTWWEWIKLQKHTAHRKHGTSSFKRFPVMRISLPE